jgi:hypothetical protein
MSERHAPIALAAIFFLYVLLIRIYDVADTFLMLGEQTRDWTIALGGLTELPLTGAPSTGGGRGFGPAYYWILWLGRHLVGPFTDNLPHAGGITVALLQSIADTWLLVALWRRVHLALALAMALLVASAPFDVAISSVIWNPPIAAALVKMATAMALMLGDTPARWKIAATAMLAWMAVQAHSSGIFVAAPLFAALALRPLVARSPNFRRTMVERAAVIATVILVLQIPYFINVFTQPDAPLGPTAALANMANVSAFRIDRSFGTVVNITGELLVRQMDAWQFQIPTLIAAAIVVVRWRRDFVLLAVSAGAIAAATLLFANWTRSYDGYWFLTLTTAMTLTFGLAIAALRSPAAIKWIGLALLAAVIVWLPFRLRASTVFFKYPQYRAMRIASYELAARATVLRDIRVTFEVHPTMDKYFMYKILGGRIDPAAPQTAFVKPDGSIHIQ